jgi:hypothetical protein
VGEALFMFGAMYFLWRTCRGWTFCNLAWFLLFFGLAFATKFSAVLLLPMFWLATTGWLLVRPQGEVAPEQQAQARPFLVKVSRAAGIFAAALLAAYVLIWAAYSFRYSAAANPAQAARAEAQILAAAGKDDTVELTRYGKLGQLPVESTVRGGAALKEILRAAPGPPVQNQLLFETMDKVDVGLGGRAILFCQKHELLPEALLFGFSYVQMKSQMRDAFLLGEHSKTGFPLFSPAPFC